MTSPLPRLVVAIVRRGVSHALADDVIGDLEARWRASPSRVRGYAAVMPLAISVWWHGWREARAGDGVKRRAAPFTMIRRTVRGLVREAPVMALAIGSLAVGIAANAAVFSLVQAVEFPSLIYPDASRIVFLQSRQETRNLAGLPISMPDARDAAAAMRALVDPALAADQDSVLREGGTNRRISGRRVEAPFFAVMRVAPAAGRVLGSGDGAGVIVLSDTLWRGAFHGDAGILGRAIRLDGGTTTVIGVMPAGFDPDADFWTPLDAGNDASRSNRVYTLFARLAPGSTLAGAAGELTTLSARLAADHADTNAHWSMYPTLVTEMHGGDDRRALLLLQGAVVVVLLIVCANVANILLARGSRRQREMAVRLALGASRARLTGELLVESTTLAAAGGAIGVGLAVWGIRIARTLGAFPQILNPRLNWMVLSFTAALAMTTGIVCGIVPALRASGVAPEVALRGADVRTSTSRAGRLGAALVVVQIAGAVVLVICGSLMVQTLANRSRVDLGFNPHDVVRGDVAMFGGRYVSSDAVRRSADDVVDHLEAAPGISAAGAVTFALPTPPGGQRRFVAASGGPAAVPGSVEAVTPRYFEAMGMPFAGGRAFAATDVAGAAPIAIVNTVLAARLWPSRSAIGQRLRLGEPPDSPVVTIVGVVSSIRRSPMHDVVIARVYVPFAQYPGGSLTFVARTSVPAAAAARALEIAVRDVNPMLVVDNFRTMDEDMARFVAPVRFTTRLLTGFGVTGLLLASLGVFGSMRYRATARRRELAVRSALGATSSELLQLVMGSGLTITLLGLAAGIGLAVLAARTLTGTLFGVAPADPMTMAGAAAGIAIVSLLACYGPARAAARVDPLTVLRGE